MHPLYTPNRLTAVWPLMLWCLPITLSHPLPLENFTINKHALAPIMTGRSVPALHEGHNPSPASSVAYSPSSTAFGIGMSNPWPGFDNVIFVRGATAPPQTGPVRLHGAAWVAGGLLAIGLILLTGLLAGLTLGVTSVDMTRLRLWTRTG